MIIYYSLPLLFDRYFEYKYGIMDLRIILNVSFIKCRYSTLL